MSILIKGMEMPKNCAECFFHKVFPATGVGINQLYCALCGINIVKLSDALPDCPLVPVPPHDGPLVSALEVINSFPEEFVFTNKQARALTHYIIPAEEGET